MNIPDELIGQTIEAPAGYFKLLCYGCRRTVDPEVDALREDDKGKPITDCCGKVIIAVEHEN